MVLVTVNKVKTGGYDCFVRDARSYHPMVHGGWYFHVKVEYYYWWNSDLYICFETNEKTARCICYPRRLWNKAFYLSKLQEELVFKARRPEPNAKYIRHHGGLTYYKSRGDERDIIMSNLKQLLSMHETV